jgi:hypothetical protein
VWENVQDKQHTCWWGLHGLWISLVDAHCHNALYETLYQFGQGTRVNVASQGYLSS